MKILGQVPLELVEWAFLKGDHACKDSRERLAGHLISQPNLLDLGENQQRRTALSDGREQMLRVAAWNKRVFHRAELEVADFEQAMTVFQGLRLTDFVDAYHRSWSFRQPFQFSGGIKDVGHVDYVNHEFRVPCEGGIPQPPAGDPASWQTNSDKSLDFHRTIWIQHNGQLVLLDGTHRAVGMYWQHRCFRRILGESKLYGFVSQ